MTATATSRPKTSSRERILKAAVKRFSQNSYERTSLRDIAGDVGIDVSYVHRCFGSKEKLFTEAIRDAADMTDLIAGTPEEIAASMAQRAVSSRPPKGQALGIFIHSISSPEALPILRQFVLETAIEPMSGRIGDASARRATLAMALLTGVTLFRNVIRVKPFVESDEDELRALIAGVLGAVLEHQGEGGTT